VSLPEKELNVLRSQSITDTQKQTLLRLLSKEEFYRKLLVPVFERQGATFRHEVLSEDGALLYSICLAKDAFGRELTYALLPLVGNLNMSEDVKGAVADIAAAINTILSSSVKPPNTNKQFVPGHVFVCCVGSINISAQKVLGNLVGVTNISYFDADKLIDLTNHAFPEFWYGIDDLKFPYLRALKDNLLIAEDSILIPEIGQTSKPVAPVTDETFVPLYLTRYQAKVKTRWGESTFEPKIQQIRATGVVSLPDRLVLIVGDGGSGKTTTLRRIAYQVANDALVSSVQLS